MATFLKSTLPREIISPAMKNLKNAILPGVIFESFINIDAVPKLIPPIIRIR